MEKESSKATLTELLQLAREDLARSHLIAAEKTLEQAILLNNQSPEAFHLLGYVYSKRGKFKKAILAFERTLSLDPNHTEAAIALSSLYNDLGRYKEAAEVYNKAKRRLERVAPGFDPRINRELAEKHRALGLMYLRYERFLEAHHEFSKAVSLEPSDISSAVQMSKCLSKSGDKNEAIRLLNKTLELHPTSAEAKVQLGVLYYSQMRMKEALSEWQDAITLDPENEMARMYLSMLDGNTETLQT